MIPEMTIGRDASPRFPNYPVQYLERTPRRTHASRSDDQTSPNPYTRPQMFLNRPGASAA